MTEWRGKSIAWHAHAMRKREYENKAFAPCNNRFTFRVEQHIYTKSFTLAQQNNNKNSHNGTFNRILARCFSFVVFFALESVHGFLSTPCKHSWNSARMEKCSCNNNEKKLKNKRTHKTTGKKSNHEWNKTIKKNTNQIELILDGKPFANKTNLVWIHILAFAFAFLCVAYFNNHNE